MQAFKKSLGLAALAGLEGRSWLVLDALTRLAWAGWAGLDLVGCIVLDEMHMRGWV